MSLLMDILHMIRYAGKLRKGDPTHWERYIRNFEKDDKKKSLKKDPIIFSGSSSIVYWKSLTEDMAPLNVLNRGFGGSQIPDVTHYINRILVHYRPRAIVFYAGENDITGLFLSKKKSAEEVRNSFQQFCEKVFSLYTNLPVYFISIKPPKQRKRYWPEIQKANLLIEEYCSSNENLHYINIVKSMLEEDGSVKHELFKWDGIHLNKKGYGNWSEVVKPILISAFPINS
ncbi:MAG: GDSL-type esterase/lipase family protein [Candidatus Hodarchaeales archaeon]|jgi:lysophospholipase L1-like esterase